MAVLRKWRSVRVLTRTEPETAHSSKVNDFVNIFIIIKDDMTIGTTVPLGVDEDILLGYAESAGMTCLWKCPSVSPGT